MMGTCDLVEVPYKLLKDPEADLEDLIFKVAIMWQEWLDGQ
jgi:hypothetical protein